MTPEEKEEFRQEIRSRLEKAHANKGINGILDEMQKCMDEIKKGDL